MSQLRHPHIVQFLGVAYLPGYQIPVLLMEKLLTSLDNLLETSPNIPLNVKVHLLTGTAQGVVYLHSHTPPIAHRDLTAKNILIDSELTAKITDLGVARMVNIQPGQLAATMTARPGTLVYMAPEAAQEEEIARYNTALDIFSFGVVALFTLTQTFPKNLKPATYLDATTCKLIARSEIERRGDYVQPMQAALGETHPLVKLTLDCLEQNPESRPSAVKVLRRLEKSGISSLANHIGEISLSENPSAIKPLPMFVSHPCVCMNERVVVVFFEHLFKISYVVATIRQNAIFQKDKFEWGDCVEYGDGCNVKAALNNRNEIIIVRSRVHSRECIYRAGMVKMDGKTIEWWGSEAKLADGVNPNVAVNDRSILFVHEQKWVFYRSYYIVGEIRDNNVRIVQDAARHPIPVLDHCQQVSVAMNNDNRVVFSCRGMMGSSTLYYATGELNGSTLENVILHGQYANGLYSHISLHGNVIMEVHEYYFSNKWVYRRGQLSLDMHDEIEWGEESKDSRTGFHVSVSTFNNRWIAVYMEDLTRELKYMTRTLTQSLIQEPETL